MSRFPFSKAGRIRWSLVPSLILIVGLACVDTLHALCDATVGAYGVCGNLTGAEQDECRDTLWGQLVPVDQGRLPAERDDTRYAGSDVTDHDFPIWQSVDIEEGFLFAAYWYGVEIWDVRGDNAVDPQLLSFFDGKDDRAPVWPPPDEDSERVAEADAPRGNSDILAVAVDFPAGLLVLDTSAKTSKPSLLYQDHSWMGIPSVYTAEIGDRIWAFGALAQGGQGIGLWDLTPTTLPGYSPCHENSSESIQCQGIRRGFVESGSKYQYIDGTPSPNGQRHFLAGSGYLGDVRIWDVTDPLAPVELVAGLDGAANNGVALWEDGGRYYLAVEEFLQLDIFDVTPCMSGGCNSLPQAMSTFPTQINTSYVTYSESEDGTPFLFVGSSDACSGGRQREWLLNVSDPEAPKDITPDGILQIDDGLGGTADIDYWGWYYSSNPDPAGFSRVAPKRGKFSGDYFYRAAGSILDIHQWATSEPTINIQGPAEAFSGDAVALTAETFQCTPTADGWSWNVDGGVINGSATGSSISVTWSTQGQKLVTATNPGCSGAEGAHSITVEEAAARVGSVSAAPNPALVCQKVDFTASDIEGRNPVLKSWEVRDAQDMVVATGGDVNPLVFDTETAGAGSYTATVTVENTDGQDTATSPQVTVDPLPALMLTGDGLPSCDPSGFCSDPPNPPIGGTVAFDISDEDQGATEWRWDFGEGDGFGPWISDPNEGPTPTHTYGSTGSFQVRVEARNCQEGPVTSGTITVQIDQLQPLVADYSVNLSCTSFGCNATAGEPVTFTNQSLGVPETCRYDWKDGSQVETVPCGSPATHTFNEPGTYRVALTIVRAAAADTTCDGEPAGQDKCPPVILVSDPDPPDPPSIRVTGSSSGTVGQTLGFSASASNCSPSPTGWNWSVGDGVISGSQTGSSIQVSWPSVGTKTVRATNSACSPAAGSLSVRITSGDDGGGGDSQVAAAFSYNPGEPDVGEDVLFDASSSTGDISFTWDFGDGSKASGQQVTHRFEQAGTYEVKLTVSEVGCISAGCPSDTETATVIVGGGGDPPLVASFTTDAECLQFLPNAPCQAETGSPVGFTGATEDADSHEWDFGDGETKIGRNVSYTWSAPGTYTVTYTARRAEETATASRVFEVAGDPLPEANSVILPWIAQADPDKILQQESDLYVHNPGPGSVKVKITFYQQGAPNPDPPSAVRTLAEHATLYFADVMTELFESPNIKGFLEIEPLEGEAQPVVTSFNRTFNEDRTYGQVIPGFPRGESPAERQGGAEVLHLVGLNDNSERLAYFGIANPNDQRLRYDLRFYDALGRPLASTSEPLGVPAFGFKQFQVENIHNLFGVRSQDDYRVAIEPVESGGTPIPFGANLRLGSRDPSFLRAGRTDAEEVFVVGALDTQGLNASIFQSDLILANPSDGLINVDLTFTGAGFFTEPTDTIEETLPPGGTTRLVDVISEWDDVGGVGVLRVASDSDSGVYPVVQGESYEVSKPDEIYGQFMPALTMDDAAVPGEPVSLVGLRQDADFLAGTRSTVWLYNPEDNVASYTLRYFDHGGTEIGVDEQLRLPPGKLRQINPGHHPLPEGGAPEGFVLRVEVEGGALLVAGQVVNDFNDPAYLVGR